MHGEFPVTKIILELSRDNLLPALLFRSARKQCDADIERLAQSRVGQLSEEQRTKLAGEVKAIMDKYSMDREVILQHPQYEALLSTGCGAHHAGQLLLWRLLLEELMTRGMLRLMVATGTVAAGVDFPARTAVITAHSKRGAEGFNVLTASELQQMSGRAGRRGKDTVGICLVAPGQFSDARVIHDLSQKPPEPLRSAYFAAPATMLNLLKFRNVDDLRFTVSRSLAAFLDRKTAQTIKEHAIHERVDHEERGSGGNEALKRAEKRVRRMLREAEILENRQVSLLERSLEGLTRLGYVSSGNLTEKGYWAAELCTSLVLELAEAIASDLFDDLSVEEIVAIVASIAGDPHRSYFAIKENPIKKEYFRTMEALVAKVRESYENPPSGDIKVMPDASLTVLMWMDSASWTDFSGYLRLAGVAEGDVARLITQTADHLNQMSRLVKSHPVLAAAAEEGRKRILKPPLTEALLSD